MRTENPRRSRLAWSALAAASLFITLPTLLAGQDPEEGVRLDIRYSPTQQPGLVVLPLATEGASGAVGSTVRGILRQDLGFSNRFRVVEGTAGVSPDRPVNLPLWRERGADWVVTGRIRGAGGGMTLEVALHDAVYDQERERRTFRLPSANDPDFRLAVHRASDAVVRWATGEPGIAATRIAFVREGRGAKEVYTVEWDGENVRRVTEDGSITLSPAWSPDGRRLAYTSFRNGVAGLYERDLATGRVRAVSEREGINITPAYSPDGRTIAFGASMDGNTELVTAAAGGRCCERKTQGRRFDSLSPTFSPDGSRIAFVSNRLGRPHLYVMSANGGDARQLTEFAASAYNVSPDWSPRGSRIAFETRVRGVPQLAVVDVDTREVRLLTSGARHEDPSWAPDGRHLVFSSPDRDGGGIFILDTVTGNIRPVVRGRGYGLTAWSPALGDGR